MTLRVAFNFNNREGEIVNFENPPAKTFETRERFIAFIIRSLCAYAWFCEEAIDIMDLFSASCCIHTEGEEYEPPSWYIECNGKIFFEQLPKDGFQTMWELTRQKDTNQN